MASGRVFSIIKFAASFQKISLRQKGTYSKLVYSKFGDPLTQLSLVSETSPETIKPNEAHVKVLYSPVNPSDLNTVKGVYPKRPPLPAVGGLEGVVEVVRGHQFKPGDRAIIMDKLWGFWKQDGIVDEKVLVKIPDNLPLEAAATLIVNPVSAYFLLTDIVPLKAGDVLIQNAANSVVGQLVIQLAKAAGIRTINVIRNRPDLSETVDLLKGLGADVVITDEQLSKGFASLNLQLPAPKLALDCVGGQASTQLAAALADGGTLTVYGRLSGQAAQEAQMDLIFRDIRVRGFWLSRSMELRSPEEFSKALNEVISLFASGKLQLPKFRKFPLDQWQDAIKHATQGFTNEKALLQLN